MSKGSGAGESMACLENKKRSLRGWTSGGKGEMVQDEAGEGSRSWVMVVMVRDLVFILRAVEQMV